MAAIDLLFDVKRDSERLHQLVLGALLERTRLLSRLLPLGGEPTQLRLQFEPEGKIYDIGLNLTFARNPPAASPPRGRVLIEIKLDSPLSEDRLAQQLNQSRLHDEDRLLYLLLGYSAITSDRAGLRERIRRIGEYTARPDLLDRVSLREADDLIPLLADPTVLPGGAEHRDARDLAAAYRDALLLLTERTRHFASHPVADWQEGDFFGFFSACRSHGVGRPFFDTAGASSAPSPARISRVTGAEGSIVGFTFAEAPLPGGAGRLDLHFENARLCLRLHTSSERKTLRQRVSEAVTHVSGAGEVPFGPLVPAPLRLSAVMTLAQRDGLLSGFPNSFDFTRFCSEMAAAEAALRKVAASVAP